MSKGVAVALALNPADEQKSLLTKRYTKSTEANQAYKMGRYFWSKRRPDDLKKAAEFFEKAIQKDANFALAFAGLADSYALLGDYGVAPAGEVFPKMKRAAARAVEIDDRLAEAHTSLADARRLFDWDWPGAEQEFKRAIELNNSYATAHHWYSEYLAGMGRFDEALEEAQRAEELDPRSLIINTNLGWILYLGRRYDEAMEELKTTLAMDPDFFLAQQLLWQTYVQKGMYDEALSGKEIKGSEQSRERDDVLKKAYDVSGWKGFNRKNLELALGRQKPGDVSGAWAGLYAAVGDYDMALRCLERRMRIEKPGWSGSRSVRTLTTCALIPDSKTCLAECGSRIDPHCKSTCRPGW